MRNIEKVDLTEYQKLSELVSALGNGTRIAILKIIGKYGEVCTCELETALGIPQSTVSVHLHRLYENGLLEKREEWKYTYYSVNPRFKELIKVVLESKE